MDIILVACVDKSWGIAKNKKMAWDIPEETHFFLETILEKEKNPRNCYLSARRSWEANTPETRQKILETCDLFCLSKNKNFDIPNNERGIICRSLDQAISQIKSRPVKPEKVFICGGLAVYRESFVSGIANKCILSFLPDDYDCDMHLDFIRDNISKDFKRNSVNTQHKEFRIEYWERLIIND